ncbi:MAG: glycosyltransferase family A protein [Romboutsia timonensis]|uniref:glycosyltransferase family A protein n=1 Tax=Romboutsia timonensis TaxID=1776391 RepID=UPI002A758574|nr:glycosyltransferase family A protein [Romboutsia timonensis]MDY3002440.1 glycosyltransferase family A protein [Romboutsia timonensis]
MKTLTVFTPAYNRAYTLHKCYESLQKQTSKDFTWLIIDDGSTDNTKELVDSWISENKIEIRYKYQENQGMHGAHNTAYELIDTELNVCIDSDDYMPEDAVENIVSFWKENKREDLAGIAGLDIYESGEIIGDKLPENIKESTYWDIYHKYKVKGDKKLVYRSDLTRKYPYPVFEGEKYVGLGYKYAKLDDNYKLLFLNKPLCVVEYMEDGSSRNMLRQYRNNPRGFSFIRIEDMKNPRADLKFKFKSCVHYVSSSLISKNRNFIKDSNCKILTILAFPIGFFVYKYIIKNT